MKILAGAQRPDGGEIKLEGKPVHFLTNNPSVVRRAQEVVDRLGARMKASRRALHLSIAEQQQVEIARALFHKSRILVMDEPTTALSDRETDRLFEIIRQLRKEGMAIIASETRVGRSRNSNSASEPAFQAWIEVAEAKV